MKEQWKPIIGFENHYEVSNLGRVKRVKTITCTKAGRILKQRKNRNGYLQVMLNKDGYRPTILVHRIVASAFLGSRPFPEFEVNHKNLDKTDNRITNLEWVTRSENTLHYRNLSSRQRGEDINTAKLTREQVLEIRAEYAIGQVTYDVLAERYGVWKTTIGHIVKRKSWKHV